MAFACGRTCKAAHTTPLLSTEKAGLRTPFYCVN